ncbi:MAG: hypothetical protein COV45_04035 [Deltaproteobacteria bacterium CG11_big_fil_rev_8_21_14_0_20_47_16]|nr:MAG: hypothetical protein COV45_04035 [Deltaproteobacteria bacterium CG11_big_fil_rev_8_21_14_0_20_47_16]
MEFATADQWQTLFDLAAWNKDELNVPQALAWLQTMIDVDPDKAAQWFHKLDFDFAVLLLQSLVAMARRQDNNQDIMDDHEWPGELPPWTLDGQYYFQGKTEEYDQLARALIKPLGALDAGFVHHLCEVAMDALPTEQVEAAFEVRERRLAEEGFPPYEEAIAIYQPLSISDIQHLPKRNPSRLQGNQKDVIPRYPLITCDRAGLFITEVMAGIQDGRFLQEFSIELASLANKVMIADQRAMEPKELRESVTKVVAMINLALEAIGNNDVEKARVALQTYWARDLFKVGVSLMRKLPLSKLPQSE